MNSRSYIFNFGDISGIGSLQPTRMQERSQSAEFTLTELDYGAFGIHLTSRNRSLFRNSSRCENLPSELECGHLDVLDTTHHSEIGRTNAVDCTHRSLSSKWLLSPIFIAVLGSPITVKGRAIYVYL